MDSPNLSIRFPFYSLFLSQGPGKPFFQVQVQPYFTCLYLPWSWNLVIINYDSPFSFFRFMITLLMNTPRPPSYCRVQGRLFDVGTLHASSNWHPFFVDLSHEKRLTLCSYQIISVNPSQFFVDAPTNLGLLWLFCLFFHSFIPIST
jgi:hypothetical protein